MQKGGKKQGDIYAARPIIALAHDQKIATNGQGALQACRSSSSCHLPQLIYFLATATVTPILMLPW
jgi:hypothetical protein